MAKGKPEPKEQAKVDPNKQVNQFIADMAALTYYEKQGNKISFESLPEAEKGEWYRLAICARLALDKMNKMVVPKVEPEDTEKLRNRNLKILTDIIKGFVVHLKTLRCPKCGSNAEARANLFPCEELAHRILDGKV